MEEGEPEQPEQPAQPQLEPNEPEPEEMRTLGEIADQEDQDLCCIKRRLAQGAGPNDAAEHYDGWAPLSCAAMWGHVEVVDALADAGADLGWKHPSLGMTALHGAARNGHAGAVRMLAARGGRAAVDERVNNSTPLLWAASLGHAVVAQALLEAGANVSLKSSSGKTALETAASRGNHEVAACIRQANEARRLCGARQRLALAMSMLASAAATAGLGELPYDVLLSVGEAAALGLPALRVVFRCPRTCLAAIWSSRATTGSPQVSPAAESPCTWPLTEGSSSRT